MSQTTKLSMSVTEELNYGDQIQQIFKESPSDDEVIELKIDLPSSEESLVVENRQNDGGKNDSRPFHRTNSSNLVQDEMLINEVRKYPCLYDRTNFAYKKTIPAAKAWDKITAVCEWVKHSDEACRLFEVLKKRYSKKKMDYKRAHGCPGSSTPLMKKTEAELKKYSFMNWMEPYIRFRSAKLNNDSGEYSTELDMNNTAKTPEMQQTGDELQINNINSYTFGGQNVNNRKRNYDQSLTYQESPSNNNTMHYKDSQKMTNVYRPRASESPSQQRTVSSSTGIPRQHLNQDIYYGVSKQRTPSMPDTVVGDSLRREDLSSSGMMLRSPSSDKDSRRDSEALNIDYHSREQQVFEEPPTKQKIVQQTKVVKNDDELFSAMLVSELQKLDGKKKYVVKHKISNILFDALIEHFDDSSDK